MCNLWYDCCVFQIKEKIDTTLVKSIKEKYGESVTITDAWDIVQVQVGGPVIPF